MYDTQSIFYSVYPNAIDSLLRTPRSSPLPLSVLPLADVDDDSFVSYRPESPPLWAYSNQRTVKVHSTAPTSLMSSPHLLHLLSLLRQETRVPDHTTHCVDYGMHAGWQRLKVRFAGSSVHLSLTMIRLPLFRSS